MLLVNLAAGADTITETGTFTVSKAFRSSLSTSITNPGVAEYSLSYLRECELRCPLPQTSNVLLPRSRCIQDVIAINHGELFGNLCTS